MFENYGHPAFFEKKKKVIGCTPKKLVKLRIVVYLKETIWYNKFIYSSQKGNIGKLNIIQYVSDSKPSNLENER